MVVIKVNLYIYIFIGIKMTKSIEHGISLHGDLLQGRH